MAHLSYQQAPRQSEAEYQAVQERATAYAERLAQWDRAEQAGTACGPVDDSNGGADFEPDWRAYGELNADPSAQYEEAELAENGCDTDTGYHLY